MRRLQKTISSFALAVISGSTVMSGCWPLDFTDDCERSRTCLITPTGSGGGTPAECVPSQNSEVVGNECGVFASDLLGDDTTGDGTKDKPFKTLATAIGQANGKPVYACSETFAESIMLSAGSELYGGLDCMQGWIYGGETARTTIAPGADQRPITLSSGAATTKVENVVARSADATVPGGSSIAAIVDGATAELTRCDFIAGAGTSGEDGESPPADPMLNGAPGNPGKDACMGDLINGNPGGASVSACEGLTVGGKGGDGGIVQQGMPPTVLAGGDGEDGQPMSAGGKSGLGEPTNGSWDCVTGAGTVGSSGSEGQAGVGATGQGTISASGYSGVAGLSGASGTPGQGGGGGGGAKGGLQICAGNTPGVGASGGSGGSGGCGGKGGGAGNGGGASIALISLNATVTLTDCTVVAGQGGNGGAGGTGQQGASGGAGASGGTGTGGSKNACRGGDGGQGGNGGPGGGGLGGRSIGIAHTGAAPEQRGAVTITPGTPGTGGLGGNMNSAANPGDDGTAAEIQAF